MSSEVLCPKCGSNQISADKKGFSGGKAVAGAVLTGGIGVVAGFHGSGKVIITCLSCGHQYKAGDYNSEKHKIDSHNLAMKAAQEKSNPKEAVIALFILWALVSYISYCFFSSDWNFLGTISLLVALVLFIIGVVCIIALQKD